MSKMDPDETLYYITDVPVILKTGEYMTLAPEDGTKWFQDSAGVLTRLDGGFSQSEMEKYRMANRTTTLDELRKHAKEGIGLLFQTE